MIHPILKSLFSSSKGCVFQFHWTDKHWLWVFGSSPDRRKYCLEGENIATRRLDYAMAVGNHLAFRTDYKRGVALVPGHNLPLLGRMCRRALGSMKLGTAAARKPVRVACYVGGLLTTVGVLFYWQDRKKRLVLTASSEAPRQTQCGQWVEGLPCYSLEQVQKHCSAKDRIWVTFNQGVYDVTEFVQQHPGGDKILMAAGSSVEPFWMLYAVHQNPQVYAMLESMRIGNLSAEEAAEATAGMEDPYSVDPKRHPVLEVRSQKPFNAEPPLSILTDSFTTVTDLFYVRNHLPVPEVDITTYELEIEGLGLKQISLSLDDLKKFPKHTVTSTIQCAGNRRSEMSQVKPVKGLTWGAAAIGNATWSGARLRDVLLAAGLPEDHPGIKHVQFEGLDTDAANVSYGASIPVEKAMDPRGDTILAYEMNGAPLSRDHGYPVRVVVPGIVGARNVKWLGRIVVSGEESSSHWQQNDYKGFSPSTDWDTVDFSKSPAIQELPVTSAICTPLEGSTVRPVGGKITVRGYAYSGGGHKVVRVDVTADGGKTWHVAKLTDEDKDSKPYQYWAWSLWKAEVPVPEGAKEVELWSKAVDSSYNTQPESFENIWNLRGVLSNAYHKVKVLIDKS
ncbi:sulfite oxidase isoform X2 [Bacillus rossius redtenbacheri]|uniref:sulfite oxidase isoform X2 n=1 Tax=Bacillus rossius redtenbacheri TaxID=93214 RepID=UPI002FDD399E